VVNLYYKINSKGYIMSEFFEVNIKGLKAELPILQLPSGVNIAFFNLHGNPSLTEHCGKELAKLVGDCEVLITAESKGLQLTHVVARELNMPFYAVARKSKKLYMQDGISVEYGSSITTGQKQQYFLSKHDVELIKGKRVAIVDDVISTGASLKGLEDLIALAGGILTKKLFVLAEGDSEQRDDIGYLATIPLL
jgi:adenine phosphoribosyltransferase